MKERDSVVAADGIARLGRRRLLRLVPGAAIAVLGLTACGSSDDDEGVEDVATRVAAEGAPDPLPTPDPNATPAEDTTGGAASGAAGEGGDATAGADAPAPGGEVIELSAPSIAWSIYEITISKAGTIRLINDGSGGPHNFIVEGYNDDAPVDMPPGSTSDWPIPADLAPGSYVYYCGIPGHRPLMEGNMTIT